MSIHNCEECKFITENKRDYQRHIKTKKHQKNVGEIEDDKGIRKVSAEYPKGIRKVSTEYPKGIRKPLDDVIYECEYCDATFKHNNNKYRHQKYRCKAKKTSDENVLLLQEKDKQIQEHSKRVEYLEKMLNDAMKKINTTNINTTNTNCTTNNIIINGYGKEDISYIKDSEWLKMLTNPRESITKLFLETHFNPEHPENTNIRQRNRNSKFIEVHDGDNWKNKKKKKMLSDVADDKQGILDDKFIKDDDIQNSMSERQKQSHSLYHDEVFYNDKKEIVEEMEACLLDGP